MRNNRIKYKTMKKGLSVILAVAMTLSFTACGSGSGDSKLQSGNNVQKAIDQQIAKEDGSTETTEEKTEKAPEAKVEAPEAKVDTPKATPDNAKSTEVSTDLSYEDAKDISLEDKTTEAVKEEAPTSPEPLENVDIDLTTMNSDMVYSTVYQLMVDSKSYVGKVIKMSGSYYASWYPETKQYYHFVIIKDATACCQQGMEFIWGNGNHVYPDEYPEEMAEVEVVGTFELYKDDPNAQFEYCRLNNCSLVVKGEGEKN